MTGTVALQTLWLYPCRYRDQGGRDRTDLTVPASWELYVDMRFDQLRTACDLELWAEAFRSVEDIQVGTL